MKLFRAVVLLSAAALATPVSAQDDADMEQRLALFWATKKVTDAEDAGAGVRPAVEELIRTFDEALKAFPDTPHWLAGRGGARLKLTRQAGATAKEKAGWKALAERDLRKAVRLAPNDAEVHETRANAICPDVCSGPDLEQAIKSLETAVRLHPAGSEAKARLARLLELAGRKEQASAAKKAAAGPPDKADRESWLREMSDRYTKEGLGGVLGHAKSFHKRIEIATEVLGEVKTPSERAEWLRRRASDRRFLADRKGADPADAAALKALAQEDVDAATSLEKSGR